MISESFIKIGLELSMAPMQNHEKIPEVGALKLQKTLEKTHNSHLKKNLVHKFLGNLILINLKKRMFHYLVIW